MEETEKGLTLPDFGALLRERRLRKGWTEEDVAEQLKITSRLVRAIEEGDMQSMPHAVYARGFIRAYAKMLAVDEATVHAACSLLKDPEEELREQEYHGRAAAPSRGSGFPGLAVLLCILFLAGGAWYLRDVLPDLFSHWSAAPEKATAIPSAPAEVPEERAPVDTPPVPAAEPLLPVNNATSPAAPLPEEPIILGGTALPPETPSSAAAPHEAALPATGHRLVLNAQADCWVSTTADGKNSQRVMHKGDTLNVDFEEKLVVKLGNAGGVEVVYDGKALPALGKVGQVKTVTFPADIQN